MERAREDLLRVKELDPTLSALVEKELSFFDKRLKDKEMEERGRNVSTSSDLGRRVIAGGAVTGGKTEERRRNVSTSSDLIFVSRTSSSDHCCPASRSSSKEDHFKDQEAVCEAAAGMRIRPLRRGHIEPRVKKDLSVESAKGLPLTMTEVFLQEVAYQYGERPDFEVNAYFGCLMVIVMVCPVRSDQ